MKELNRTLDKTLFYFVSLTKSIDIEYFQGFLHFWILFEKRRNSLFGLNIQLDEVDF